MVGVNYLRYINSKSYMESIVSYSATSQTGDFYDKNIDATYQQKFVNQALRLSSLYNYKLNARNSVRLGVIINHLDFNLYDKDNEDGPYEINVDRKGNTQLFQA